MTEKQEHKKEDFFGFTEQEVRMIKNSLNFQINDDELLEFLHACKTSNLDPIRRQIYCIRRGNKITIQTSIDGFRLIADRTGKYAPGKPTEYVFNNNQLICATAYVKKLVGGEWHEIGEQAFFAEYNGKNIFWREKPAVMLSKVAESRALRRAFPSDLCGLYTEEEMPEVKAHQHHEKQENDPKISNEIYEKLDEYVNGYDDLRENIKKLCKVNSLKEIRESQIEACRKFARNHVERLRHSDENSKEKSLPQ